MGQGSTVWGLLVLPRASDGLAGPAIGNLSAVGIEDRLSVWSESHKEMLLCLHRSELAGTRELGVGAGQEPGSFGETGIRRSVDSPRNSQQQGESR